MSKKRKNKKAAQQSPGGYKRFLRDLYATLQLLGIENQYFALSNESKRYLFRLQIKIRNPEAASRLVFPKDLKRINERARRFYKSAAVPLDDKVNLSCYQLWMLYSYYSEIKKIEKKKGIGEGREGEYSKKAHDFLRLFLNRLSAFYYTALLESCNPAIKYLSVKFGFAEINKKDPRMELIIQISAVPAIKKSIVIGGINRPAFRIGVPGWGGDGVKWVSIKTSELEPWYHGKEKEIEVYIQSHALIRMNQRLDLMSQEYINFALWENTAVIRRRFIFYRNYLLLPFKLHDIKIGYLAGKIVDDKLLFRTFLFITHNCTPEGDKLKELSGLTKEDVRYWGIDRLSAFMRLDEEKNPELVRIFAEAGISDIFKLKVKAFDQEAREPESLAGLEDYIHKNQEASRLNTEFIFDNIENDDGELAMP